MCTILALLINSPYIIDLESTNGTFVNDVEIPKASYYQLKHTDGTYMMTTGANGSGQIWHVDKRVCARPGGCLCIVYAYG